MSGSTEGGRLFGTLAGVLAGVLVFFVIVIGLLWFGGDPAEDVEPPLAATPMVPTIPPATTAPTPEPTPSPTPEASPTPTPTPVATDREPTDADAAAFASAFEPPGGQDVESVTVDITGDGRAEIVVVSVAQEVVRLDVATWNGTAYEVTFSDAGGPAGTIERFTVRDLAGDGIRDIATVQVTEEFETLSIWGWDGSEVVRREAEGGCWEGSHVYGIVGVELREGEIAATCDDSPLPAAEWSTDVYVWDDGAWRYDRTDAP